MRRRRPAIVLHVAESRQQWSGLGIQGVFQASQRGREMAASAAIVDRVTCPGWPPMPRGPGPPPAGGDGACPCAPPAGPHRPPRRESGEDAGPGLTGWGGRPGRPGRPFTPPPRPTRGARPRRSNIPGPVRGRHRAGGSHDGQGRADPRRDAGRHGGQHHASGKLLRHSRSGGLAASDGSHRDCVWQQGLRSRDLARGRGSTPGIRGVDLRFVESSLSSLASLRSAEPSPVASRSA